MRLLRTLPLPATPRAWLVHWRLGAVAPWLLALALGLALLLVARPAAAAAYTFPTAMPPGCSGSNGNYTCAGGGSLGSGDTVIISGTRPATITISGSVNVNGAKINQGGATGDLTLIVNGVLTPGYQGVINANVTAYSVSDTNGYATFGGTLRTTSGSIALAYLTTVASDINASGSVTLADEVVAGGNITAGGNVTTGNRSRIAGSVSAGDDSSFGQDSTVGGSITVPGGNDIDIGYGAVVDGNIRSDSGTITLAQNAVARACVQVADSSDPIRLGTQARAAAVCCGAVGSCSNSCVSNNSGYSMPPVCTNAATLLAKYNFEDPAYTGAAAELADTAGHAAGPFNGRGIGAPLPGPASARPARAGSPGTCGYASLPGPESGGGAFMASGLPVSTSAGAKTSVSFWMYWDGISQGSPIGWDIYSLWFFGSNFGFNTGGNDLQGTSSSGLANGWHHVVAVFVNGSVAGSKLYIDGVLKTLTQTGDAPDNSAATVSSAMVIGGWGYDSNFRHVGRLDQVRVYSGELTSTQVSTLYNETQNCEATLIARYDFNEASYNGTAGEWRETAGYSGGPFHGRGIGASLPTTATATPARSGSPGTCRYASFAGPSANGPALQATGLPITTTAGATTTAAFWMNWSGSNDSIVLSFGAYDLWFASGHFGFNTNASDIYGISSSGLSGVWKHVVAVFVNGAITSNVLYIDGVRQTLTQRTGTPNSANMVTTTSLQVSGYAPDNNHRYGGLVDSLRVFSGAPSSAQVASLHAETPSTCNFGPARLRIEHASGSGLTCTPATLTVRACSDAACSSDYTGGAVSGSLGSTGGSVAWPDGAGFSIAAGSSTTTVRMQSTSTTATLLGVASSTPTAANAATCNFGNPVCTFTAADSGLLFDVPHHAAETAPSFTVSAVKKADNSLACTPALASVTRSVNFSCAYTNPTSGTLPVRVAGSALNAAGNAAAACDSTGRSVNLAFNASGVATTSLQYADAGQMTLNATYTGSAGTNDAGLVMTGSDSFIAAPDHFTIDGVTAAPIRAGASFGATVTARNSAGATTPNHGRETAAQRASIGWVKLQPTGSGAVAGSFSGTDARSFTNGAVTVSDLSWTEVGRGDLVVRGSDAAGYMGSGLHVFGSSAATGARHCAAEGGNCVLPGGATATVYYGAPGGWAVKAGQTGTVACTNANFGDPLWGTAKRCYYVVTSASNGSVGDFIPQRFSVAAPNACGAFTYGGQPTTATVTALNAAGNTTLNFNGTASTTPTFAQAVTLSDANALGLGTLSGASIAASAFSAGVATSQVSYAFTSKATAPQSLLLRAGNGASGASLVSSAGGTEATLALRSGRLRLSNAFGSAAAALQVPAVTEYWGGNAWLLNSADSCTALAGASVALSNPRSATGGVSTATTSAGALAISNGSGTITLAAPSPARSSLSLDLAVNLGSSGTDQSCQAAHPATTGAGKPWLRAINGSCATSADRDPAARASFGIFSPETRKTVHVRELF